MIYRVDFTLVHYLALWYIRPLGFLIYSTVRTNFGRPVFYLFGRLDSAYWTSPDTEVYYYDSFKMPL